MQLTFRSKLLAGQLVLVALVMAIVTLTLDRSLSADLRGQLEERLLQQALGSASWINQNRHPDKLVTRLAESVGADVTLFDREGAVVASSLGQFAGSTIVGGAELVAARETGVGRAVRPLGGRDVAHVAVPTATGLLRLSAPLSDIDSTVAEMRLRLLYASLVGVLSSMILVVGMSMLVARPLRTMRQAADRIADGDYDVELPPRTDDDFGKLAASLGTLASQLRGDMARIERLERVRRDFVANVSHELRTPITAIQGCAEILMDAEADPEETREFAEACHRHAQRLGTLVAGLLRLSRLEARGEEDVVVEPVDVTSIGRRVVETARARAQQPELDIRLDMPDELIAAADPLAVEQVLDNLVDNAIKYGAGGGVVIVAGATEGDEVVVAVRDEGAGIGEEHLGRIFERFYRADAGRSREHGGTGLGLSITKRLVEAMGGTIDVESTPGIGTRFTVRLPRDR
ncbi:MAG TPA: sensor histidine kinase [Polyangiaceae bacterium]|nr:sensor histidine kinase [Polyangiaceae bacterium]